MEIIIDLKQNDRQPVNVEMGWAVEVVKKFHDAKRGGLGKFLRRHQHIEKSILLNITDISVDKALSGCCREEELFSVVHETQRYTQRDMPVAIPLKSEMEPFSIFFHQERIIDCNLPQNGNETRFSIRFNVTLADAAENGEVFYIYSEEVMVRFAPMENKPETRYFPAQLPLLFSSVGDTVRKVTDLGIKLPNTLKRAPQVDCTIDFDVLDEDCNSVPGLLVVAPASDPRKPLTDHPQVSLTSQSTKLDNKGAAFAVARYSLFFDLSKIKNPLKKEYIYTIVPTAKFKYSYRTNSPSEPLRMDPFPVVVKKDEQGTELVVELSRDWNSAHESGVPEHRVIKCPVENNTTVDIPSIRFTARAGLQTPVQVALCNKATDRSFPRAGLRVRNLFLSTSFKEENIAARDNTGQQVSPQSIINLHDADPELETAQGFFIPNGEDSRTLFQVRFNHNSVSSVRRDGLNLFDYQMATHIEFDYQEDTIGDGAAPWKHYCVTLEWTLHQDPNPEWLAVDYGSSAIVCSYGSGEGSSILDLRDARTKVYRTAKQDSERNPHGFSEADMKDKVESGTLFLPSDILFNDVDNEQEVSSLCSQSPSNAPTVQQAYYNQMSVLLSPTSSLVVKNFHRQLPCLKVLMGNELLPNNVNYNEYSYRIKDITGDITSVKVAGLPLESDMSLLRIENIFREAYHTLFHYFVQDKSIVDQTNQVVITYPNTYTPRNLFTLKNIVSKLLPNVRNIQFVSESDAVAAYYMYHWHEYHRLDDDIKRDENILVYDMGAGTLDVTYLTKHYQATTDQYELSIEGKLGTGRAGNYLDYIIGQILGEIVTGFKPVWIGTSTKGVMHEDLEARVTLKAIIKNTIKPHLNLPNKEVSFKIGDDKFSVMPLKIIEHPLYQKFLSQCTDQVWNNLKQYVGEENFHVDTIIMSGRSMRLKTLSDSLSKVSEGAFPVMLDKIINGPQKNKPNDRTKTAVVEGARIYVETYSSANSNVVIKSRRLHASYGVAYRQTGGRWAYVELLNKDNIPYAQDNKETFRRKEGPLVINGTNQSDTLRLIQTYLSERDTINALNSESVEFVSVMSEVMMSALGNPTSLKVDVEVDRNNNVALIANGQPTPDRAPKGVDLRDTITRHGLWPVSIEG